MLKAITRVKIISREGAGVVQIISENDKIVLSAESEAVGKITEVFDLNYPGLKFAFSTEFFLNILRHLENTNLVLELDEPTAPLRIREENGKHNRWFILMPMFYE